MFSGYGRKPNKPTPQQFPTDASSWDRVGVDGQWIRYILKVTTTASKWRRSVANELPESRILVVLHVNFQRELFNFITEWGNLNCTTSVNTEKHKATDTQECVPKTTFWQCDPNRLPFWKSVARTTWSPSFTLSLSPPHLPRNSATWVSITWTPGPKGARRKLLLN